MPSWLRSPAQAWLLPVGLILVAQGAALHLLSLPERNVPNPQLSDLPRELGGWKTVGDQSLEPGVLEYLRPDSYILRDYRNEARESAINLFVAHFKSLQSGYGPHSPSVCLPGNGWLVRSSRTGRLAVPGRPAGIPVNEYVLEKSAGRILVLYWYQNDRNVWAQELQGKLRLLPDLIRYRRSDVSLVRVIEALRGENEARELADCREFSRLMFPSLAEDFKKGD